MAAPSSTSTSTPNRSASAIIDMFVKIKGTKQGLIKGESKDAKHKDETIVKSYSWDIIQPVAKTGLGFGTGKRQHGPFKFVMPTQSSTPKLMSAAATGEVLSDVTFTCRKAGGQQQEYIVWKLTNAVVSRINTGYLTDQHFVPHDEVSLMYQKIEMDYKEQNADGSLGGGIIFADDWVG